jgi:uncharacterized protein
MDASLFLRWLSLLGACALAASCSILAPLPDPSRFFVLEAVAPVEVAPSQNTAPASIGVGPIHLPDYLVDRHEMVTRLSPTEVAPSKIDHWAEPLDDSIPRILGLNLSSRLGTHRIVFYPWYRSEGPDYQVAVDFQRFERDIDGNAALVARFEVRGLRGTQRTLFRETRASRTPTTADSAALAAALSETLAELSHDITLAIRELEVTS